MKRRYSSSLKLHFGEMFGRVFRDDALTGLELQELAMQHLALARDLEKHVAQVQQAPHAEDHFDLRLGVVDDRVERPHLDVLRRQLAVAVSAGQFGLVLQVLQAAAPAQNRRQARLRQALRMLCRTQSRAVHLAAQDAVRSALHQAESHVERLTQGPQCLVACAPAAVR